jgi:hypothetical protein
MGEGALGPVQAQFDLFNQVRTAKRYSSLPIFAPAQRQQGEESAHNYFWQIRKNCICKRQAHLYYRVFLLYFFPVLCGSEKYGRRAIL